MERRSVSSYQILRGYVLREFLLSLLVAFLFFFFIFFINQILLFAQRILLKNVSITSVLQLVGLSIPQILLYTIPFSTLSAASMTIGDLSARNELLAFRAAGISLWRMFEPIALMGIILAVGTFLIADIVLPYSHQRFKTLYTELLRDLPTLEIDSFAVNKIGDIVLVTGQVNDDGIESLVLFDTSNRSQNQVISATGGSVALVDVNSYLYRLDLSNPIVLQTDSGSLEEFSLASADSLTYYLDFSSQLSRFTDVTPSQLSSRDLLRMIATRKIDLQRDKDKITEAISYLERERAEILADKNNPERLDEIQLEIENLKNQKIINFYLQYYRAELHKKIALSASCFFLVFITFPLSFLKLKHGRLFGFALSLIVASAYWFLLFFAQTQILDYAVNPGFLMWAPNAIVVGVSALLLIRARRV